MPDPVPGGPPIGRGVGLAAVFTLVATPIALLTVQALGDVGGRTLLTQGGVVLGQSAAVDTDRDGISNAQDTDDDGDKVPDRTDAFPLIRTESKDTDGDKVGNNSDPDRDGDGYLNKYDPFPDGVSGRPDFDNDGTEDAKDPDVDGDGTKNTAEKGGATGTYAYDADNNGKHDRLERALNAKYDTDRDGTPDVVEMVKLAKELAERKYGMTFTGAVNDFSSFPKAFFARVTAGELGACVTGGVYDGDNDGLSDGIADKNKYVAYGGPGGDYFAKYERNYAAFAAKAEGFGFALGAPNALRSAADASFIGDYTKYQLPPAYHEGSGYGIYTAQNAVPEFKNAIAEHAFYENLYVTGKPPATFQGHYEVYASSGSGGAPVVYDPTQFTQQYGYTTDYGQVTSSGGYTTTGGGTYDPSAGTYTYTSGSGTSGGTAPTDFTSTGTYAPTSGTTYSPPTSTDTYAPHPETTTYSPPPPPPPPAYVAPPPPPPPPGY